MPGARHARRLCLYVALALGLFAVDRDALAQEARPEKRGKKYRVRIDSAPQQAAVYLDDERYGIVGYTPYSGSLQKGTWTVILKKEGYEVGRRVITVARRSAVQETFVPLVKKIEPGVIEVRADADQAAFGAQVFVDGQLQGQIPAIVSVPAGRHLVEVKKADADPFSQWIELKEGERVTVNPMLKGQARGSILVDADVPDAEVFLDGNKVEDKTPTLIPNVVEGPHIVEVRKEPAMPWKQSVNVIKGQTLKVSASLKATVAGEGGSIRVLSDVTAEISLDGRVVGRTPIDIRDVKPGQHIVEARAAGHRSREETVTVAAGSALVLKMDLGEAGVGTIKVVSPLPESDVSIDGESLGPAPQQKSVSAGEHLVAVSKAGYARFEAKVTLEPGQTRTVTAELAQVGGARFVSSPSGAEVLFDGRPIGTTPLVNEELAAGEHVVTIRKKGFDEFQQTIKIEAGKTGVVNATLEVGRELAIEQRGLSAFGAKAMSSGRSIVGLGVGYPYFLDTRFAVGVPSISGRMPIDVGVLYRMYGVNFELGLLGRLTLVNVDPFSLSAFVEGGGGSALGSRNSKRNNFFMNAGAAASLTGLGAVTVTGRLYGAMWSERLCPGLNDAGTDFEKSKPSELCKDYLNDALEPEDRARVDELLGGPDKIYQRNEGFRAMFSLIVEIAIKQHWSAWMLIDGTIFQEERAAYTDVVNPIMFDDDFLFYPRFGLTYKF